MFRNKTALRISWWLFIAAVMIVNGILTFSFGYTYARHAFANAGALAPILGGAFLTLFYDLGAIAGFAGYTLGKSREQRGIAMFNAVVCTIASTTASVLQLMLGNSLYQVPPELMTGAGIIGLLMMVFVAGMLFVSFLAYQYFDPDYQEQDADLNFQADIASYRLEKKAEMLEKVRQQVDVMLAGEMGGLVEQEAYGQLTIMRSLLLNGSNGTRPDENTPVTIEGDYTDATATAPAAPVASMAATPPAREEVALAHDNQDTPFGQAETEDEEGKTA